MHLKRDFFIGVAIGAGLLLGVRAALPEALQWYVNRTLDRAESYDGQVGDIDLSLYTGTYRIRDVDIVKTDGAVPVPLFSAPVVEFSLLWSALLNGAAVGEIALSRPQLNIVDSPREDERQTGLEADWLTLVEELFPLRIDRITLEDGEFHFRNFQSEPQVDLYLTEVEGNLYNLTNSERLAESLVASGRVDATALGSGRLAVEVELDPYADPPAFDLNARLLDLDVVRLNDFIAAYLSLDAESGSLDLATEMAAADGRLEGYIKPLIQNLEIFGWEDDVEEGNVLEGFWEALVDTLSELLENQPEDQVATNIPFSGSIENPETGTWAAIGNILSNAFVEAFQANLEGSISLDFGEEEAGDREEAGEQEGDEA